MTAPMGTAAYGTPSVVIQSLFAAKIVQTIDGDRFTPTITKSAALVELVARPAPDRRLDVLAHALLHQRGMRVKDLLHSHRLKQALAPSRRRDLLRSRELRGLQQRRLNELTSSQISQIAVALRTGLQPDAITERGN